MSLTPTESQQRLAVLIDADNTSGDHANDVMTEITKHGTATVRRAYGNWDGDRLGKWKAALLHNAIQPVQQFDYTKGKNATDSALIIDAMDLLYAGNLDGFVIVSSDSDFTPLATRLRESAKEVIGIGARKTPESFVRACNRFIFLDLLAETPSPSEAPEPDADAPRPPRLRDLLTKAIEDSAQDDGWSDLSAVGKHIKRSYPAFDERDYSDRKISRLSVLIKAQAQRYVEVRTSSSPGGSTVWVRMRPEPTKKAATKKP